MSNAPGRRNRWGCGILIAPLIVVAGFAVLYSKSWHPSDAAYPTQGIDVSAHEGPIDWALLPAQGVDFAFIKATEGGDFTDRRFAENWRASAEAGIPRGAYHFFTLCRPGAEQAAHLIATVPQEESALPPAVDLEYVGNCSERPEPAALHRELKAFLAKVEGHFGQPALPYLTSDFDAVYAISESFDRPLWLRSIYFEPRFGARDWDIWQASQFRMLDGIEGRVDWNVMHARAN